MNPLSLPRTLANALLSDVQSGSGTGLVGAENGIPCSVYPAPAAAIALARNTLHQRGESLFAYYAAAEPDMATLDAPPDPLDPPYQLRLTTDIRGVIVLRAYARNAQHHWQEQVIELIHD